MAFTQKAQFILFAALGIWCSQPAAAAPSISAPTSLSVNGTQTTVTLTPSGGIAPYTYQWTIAAPTGVTKPVRHTPLAASTVLDFFRIGDYRLRATVWDASGASASTTIPLTVNATPSSVAIYAADAVPESPSALPAPAFPSAHPGPPPPLPPAYASLDQLKITAEDIDTTFNYLSLERCTPLIGLKYAAPFRYDGATLDARRDYRKTLNLYLPTGFTGPRPVVFHVHGGAYSAGNKDGVNAAYKTLMQKLLDEGFAVVSFAYPLTPQGIFPQVWWDFQDAARYLRKHATLLNLDPRRFGAFGFSAGGWLITSAAVNPDLWRNSQQASMTTAELATTGHRALGLDATQQLEDRSWLRRMSPGTPAHPGFPGTFQALSFDFDFHLAKANAASPALQKWVGLGHIPSDYPTAIAAGADFTLTELVNLTGSLHLPPFYNHTDALAKSLDGTSTKNLGDVVFDFFVLKLTSPSTRAPQPDFYPAERFFTGSTTIELVPVAGTTLHYTTDGSTPTTNSPVYSAPFTISATTTIKTLVTSPGMANSAVNSVTFYSTYALHQITTPASSVLPPGVVGQPYTATFTSTLSTPRWLMQADLTPYTSGTSPRYPNGMSINLATGVWSGTPTTPGTYHIQVWVNQAPGYIASYRDFSWTVTGAPLSENPWGAPPAGTDTNVELASLNAWSNSQVTTLNTQLSQAGFQPTYVAPLLYIPAEQKTDAKGWMQANLTAAQLATLSFR